MNPNHTSKDTLCVLDTVEKQPSEMTQPLAAASPQTSQVQLFVSGLSFVFLGILSFFSALAVQKGGYITYPRMPRFELYYQLTEVM